MKFLNLDKYNKESWRYQNPHWAFFADLLDDNTLFWFICGKDKDLALTGILNNIKTGVIKYV